MPNSVNKHELAAALKVCDRTIDRRIERGEIPVPDLTFRNGSKLWYLPTLERVNIRGELFVDNAA